MGTSGGGSVLAIYRLPVVQACSDLGHIESGIVRTESSLLAGF